MAKGLRFKDAEKARDEITNDQLKRISKLYNDWADDIAKKAEQLKRKGTMSSELQERQMKELEQALRKASEQVANDVTKTLKNGMTKICQSVIAENADWMESLGFPKDVITAAFSSVPDNVVRNIVTGKIYDSGWSLSQSIWGDNEDTLAKIHEIVAGGMAENKPIYDIAKDLEQYVRPDARKQWNLRTESGKMIYPKKVDYNAQRLARTLSQHSYQQSIKATSSENPFIQKVKWHSSGNRVCEICKKRNGKVFPIDKLPMDHPNGFCIMEQLVDDNIDDRLIDWVNGKEDKELDGFAKKLGFSVDDMNVKEGKASQHDIIQEQILEKYGYSKDNMPESYVKLFMQLEKNPEDLELFFKMAKEKGLNGPQFYDKYIAKHKWGTAKPSAKTITFNGKKLTRTDVEGLDSEEMYTFLSKAGIPDDQIDAAWDEEFDDFDPDRLKKLLDKVYGSEKAGKRTKKTIIKPEVKPEVKSTAKPAPKPVQKSESKTIPKANLDKGWVKKNCITPKMVKGIGATGDGERDALIDLLSKDFVDDSYRTAFSKAQKMIGKFKTTDKETSYFQSRWNGSYIVMQEGFQNVDPRYKYENKYNTLFHEMGHAIDKVGGVKPYSSSDVFLEAMRKDFDALVDKLNSKDVGTSTVAKMGLKKMLMDGNSYGVQDAISAAQYIDSSYKKLGEFRFTWAHSKEYWNRNDPELEAASELFANISSSMVSQSESKYMDTYFPNAKKVFKEIMEQIMSEVQ